VPTLEPLCCRSAIGAAIMPAAARMCCRCEGACCGGITPPGPCHGEPMNAMPPTGGAAKPGPGGEL
jgi:hypothetical protein